MGLDQFSPDTAMALLNASQAATTKSAQGLQSLKHARMLEKIDESAQDFEAVFISEMMRPMFDTVETDSMFGGGKGEEVFKSLLIDQYGKIIAQTGSLGITDEVKAQMIKMQEAANGMELATASSYKPTTSNLDEATDE